MNLAILLLRRLRFFMVVMDGTRAHRTHDTESFQKSPHLPPPFCLPKDNGSQNGSQNQSLFRSPHLSRINMGLCSGAELLLRQGQILAKLMIRWHQRKFTDETTRTSAIKQNVNCIPITSPKLPSQIWNTPS